MPASEVLSCIRHYYQKKNYYDLLGLSPKATQADVKKAYYKLSMQYHPDKTEGDETKFREITSAYEILGNIKLRRLYDQGLISHRSKINPSPEDLQKGEFKPEAESRFYRSRVPMSGKTKVYDFDEWSRMHYEKVRTRSWEARQKMDQDQSRERSYRPQIASELGLLFGAVFVLAFVFVVSSLGTDYDRPSKRPPRDDS